MRNIVHLFVFEGFADWEAALALCEVRRPGDFRIRTVATDRRPVQSMGGLTLLPDLAIDEIAAEEAVLAIVPGGTWWERGAQDAVTAALRALHAAGATIGALSAGVLALAHAGLLDARRHTANDAGYVETYVPTYRGAARCETDALAVADDRVITAAGVAQVEFAREVIRALDLYDARDTELWYRLYKHAEPPPWLAAAGEPALT